MVSNSTSMYERPANRPRVRVCIGRKIAFAIGDLDRDVIHEILIDHMVFQKLLTHSKA